MCTIKVDFADKKCNVLVGCFR